MSIDVKEALSRNPVLAKLNPHLVMGRTQSVLPEMSVHKSISTDEQKLNKLETDFLSHLREGLSLGLWTWVGVQNITLKLAHDTRYTPDFTSISSNGTIVFHEVKGPQFWDDAKVKLKIAARQFLFAKFILVRRIEGQWQTEAVKP